MSDVLRNCRATLGPAGSETWPHTANCGKNIRALSLQMCKSQTLYPFCRNLAGPTSVTASVTKYRHPCGLRDLGCPWKSRPCKRLRPAGRPAAHRSTSFPQNVEAELLSETEGRNPYSGGPMPSGAMDSNRVDRLTKASLTLPVGPLRCLAMMSSARPSSSGSSGL